MTTTAPAPAPPSAPGGPRGRLAEVGRAAAAPLISAVLIIGLLAAWVASGGAGSVTRIRVQITLAAVPMRAYLPRQASAIHRAPTYLTIRNLSGRPDELLSASTPIARQVILTGPPGPRGERPTVARLPVPAHSSITLSPLSDDVVLVDPAPYESDMTVPLTLVFRHAGRVQVDAAVSAPGSP
ncbi:MAG TPA: copper chaperone PCu(A)C [Streptosporangiaceae bacterium]|nr:copper chaperone PCu(A)C [Streptosporangiaceae bacterium]